MEITNLVERLEVLEEKCGIAISALYASYVITDYSKTKIIINFDLTSLSGGSLKRNVYMRAGAYNSAGQLLGTASSYRIYSNTFLGFKSQSITIDDLDKVPEKIRLHPTG